MSSHRVLLFARYAECFGSASLEVTLPTPATVADLVHALRQMPGGELLPPQPLVAVNLTQVGNAHPLVAGDEIALLPPLAGG